MVFLKGEAMSFLDFLEKYERVMFAFVYTLGLVVILLDLFYWRPY